MADYAFTTELLKWLRGVADENGIVYIQDKSGANNLITLNSSTGAIGLLGVLDTNDLSITINADAAAAGVENAYLVLESSDGLAVEPATLVNDSTLDLVYLCRRTSAGVELDCPFHVGTPGHIINVDASLVLNSADGATGEPMTLLNDSTNNRIVLNRATAAGVELACPLHIGTPGHIVDVDASLVLNSGEGAAAVTGTLAVDGTNNDIQLTPGTAGGTISFTGDTTTVRIEGTALQVNHDAVVGTAETPSVLMRGGNGAVTLSHAVLRLDPANTRVEVYRQEGAVGAEAAAATNLHVGEPGGLTNVDNSLVFNSSTGGAPVVFTQATDAANNTLTLSSDTAAFIVDVNGADSELRTQGLAFRVNRDATVAAETPVVTLHGGTGAAIDHATLKLDPANTRIELYRQEGAFAAEADVATAVHIGRPGQVANVDASVVLNSSVGAAPNVATVQQTGATNDLRLTQGTAGGTVTAGPSLRTEGTSLRINSDAAAGGDEDPTLTLEGSDAGGETNSAFIYTARNIAGAAGEPRLDFYVTDDGTRISPRVVIGQVGETTASLDAFLEFEAATNAGVNATADIRFLGEENDLVLGTGAGAVSAAVNFDAEAGLDVTGANLTLADGLSITNAGAMGITVGTTLTLTAVETSTWSLTANNAVDQTLNISATNAGAGGGILALAADSQASIGDGTATLTMAAGAVSTAGMTTIDLDGSGAVSLESSGGALNVGADAIAQAVNIATGAAARVITIGNAASASLALEAGVGAFSVLADTTAGITCGTTLALTAPTSVDVDSPTIDIATQDTAILLEAADATALIIGSAAHTNMLTFDTTAAAEQVDCAARLTTTDNVAAGTERVVGGRAYSNVASGAALTNSVVETVLGSYTIPADTLKAGSVMRVRALVRATADLGATTLTLRLRLGPVTLIGTALITTAAVDTAVNDVAIMDYTFQSFEAPALTGECRGTGFYTDPAAAGGAFVTTILGAGGVGATFATNAALLLEVTGIWSAADANSCQLEQLVVNID